MAQNSWIFAARYLASSGLPRVPAPSFQTFLAGNLSMGVGGAGHDVMTSVTVQNVSSQPVTFTIREVLAVPTPVQGGPRQMTLAPFQALEVFHTDEVGQEGLYIAGAGVSPADIAALGQGTIPASVTAALRASGNAGLAPQGVAAQMVTSGQAWHVPNAVGNLAISLSGNQLVLALKPTGPILDGYVHIQSPVVLQVATATTRSESSWLQGASQRERGIARRDVLGANKIL